MLEAVFHFNDTDLRYNRNGRISDRQKLRLRCMQVLSPLHLFSFLFIVIHFVSLVHLVVLAINGPQANDCFGLLRMFIGFVVLNVVTIYVTVALIKRLQKLNSDIQNGWVETKRGSITYRRYYRYKLSIAYLIRIEGKEYRVMFWQAWAFRKHAEYAVYVAPQMQLILSAERI
ncbi:MAG: hypothetical protein AAGH78_15290 [Cyanobacteria bacterium P01_H01_bin.58]